MFNSLLEDSFPKSPDMAALVDEALDRGAQFATHLAPAPLQGEATICGHMIEALRNITVTPYCAPGPSQQPAETQIITGPRPDLFARMAVQAK